jgi:hypothetical protein
MKNDFFIYLVTCQGLFFATLLYLLFTRDIPEPGMSSPSRLRILVNSTNGGADSQQHLNFRKMPQRTGRACLRVPEQPASSSRNLEI